MRIGLDLAIGAPLEVELGHAVHGRADVDRGALVERQAGEALLVGPMLQGRLVHVPADRIMGAGDGLPGCVDVAVLGAGHQAPSPIALAYRIAVLAPRSQAWALTW